MPDPMYRQIAEDLRQKIESGELGHGTQLPTELELREQYDASRNTVRDAIKLLITRGLVETRPGQGTFVVAKINPFVTTLTGDPETGFGGGEDDIYDLEVKAGFREPTTTNPRIEIHQASNEVAPELQLDESTMIVSRHQQRFIDGTPWSLQTSFYPMSLVDQGASRLIQAADIPEGTVAYLKAALGIKQAGWRDMITVRPPNENEAAFFKLPSDGRISVIETRRIAFGDNGEPVRLTISTYPADRNQFAVNVGNVPAEIIRPPEADSGRPEPYG